MRLWNSIRGRLLITVLVLNACAISVYTVYAYVTKHADTMEMLDAQLIAAASMAPELLPESVYGAPRKTSLPPDLLKLRCSEF
ncbi:hypothetical protein AGMMS49545_16410 [Betaproteobacteria bacterium]|nr:hypothetical protein AGMMS49545_16410 [Betaproteobacteria bacterium]GHU46803.1 hypothetical protein AGMMS50289_21010 [Betaproteobacteria bacterium]